MSELSHVTLGPSGLAASPAVPSMPVPVDDSSRQATDELIGVVKQLSHDLAIQTHESYGGPFDWAKPMTHFVDSLSSYNALEFAMLMVSLLVFASMIIFAWALHKKNIHQHEMLKAMSVPLDAFTSVVHQSSTSTEMLVKRLETVGDHLETMTDRMGTMNDHIGTMNHRMGAVVDGLDQLNDTVNRVILQQKTRSQKPESTHTTIVRGAAAQHG